MERKNCCIFGAGSYSEDELPLPADPLIIAADGGRAYLEKRGLAPHMTIGDFDSLGYVPQGERVVQLNPVKDETDMLSAINLGLEQGCNTFYLYGGTGGRTAHTIANLQLLAMLARRGCRGYLCAGQELFTALHKGSISFSPRSQGYLSVFSLTSRCAGVTERGLKYTLEDALLTYDYPLGVSNEFTGQPASISVQEGVLLLVYTRQAEEVFP